MKNINELLREADPIQYEPPLSLGQRAFRRQAILAAASVTRANAGASPRSRMAILATACAMIIAALILGAFVWSMFISDLQAAIRFEVRLAEVQPASGLREAKVSDSGRTIYLHNEVILTNSDIGAARVVPGSGPSQFNVSIEFNRAGAEKMSEATANHIGKPVAILLDGQVVMAPMLRSPIRASAMITGNFTKSYAERVVRGIEIH